MSGTTVCRSPLSSMLIVSVESGSNLQTTKSEYEDVTFLVSLKCCPAQSNCL